MDKTTKEIYEQNTKDRLAIDHLATMLNICGVNLKDCPNQFYSWDEWAEFRLRVATKLHEVLTNPDE